jgi:hypothetical protein
VASPASITSINDYVFNGCSGLAGVTIPSSVTSIGTYAFSGCSGLTSVAIPVSITSISDYAFYGCSGLASVTIPSSVTSIGTSAFSGCSGLTTITFEDANTYNSYDAFSLCSNLTRVIYLGNAPSYGNFYDKIEEAFSSAASSFKIYYFNDAIGFTSPTWYGYPTVNMGDRTKLKTWLIDNQFPYNTDLKNDHNDDGVSLLMAYALKLDPHNNLSGSMPKPVFFEFHIDLSFFSGIEEVSYVVEASTDLEHWSTEGVSISTPDANQMRTASIPRTGPCRFLRLAVSH